MVNSTNIQTITIHVTEQIHKSYIDKFLLTKLELNHIIPDDNTYISYSFIANLNIYEIYVVINSSKEPIILPEILNKFYTKQNSKHTVDLFILKDFFTIYKNQQFYIFKTIPKLSNLDDIQSYITKTYNLTIDNTYKIDDTKFEEIKNLYIKDIRTNKLKYFKKIKETKSFYFFIFFNFVCIIIFLYYLYISYDTTICKLTSKLLSLEIQQKQLECTSDKKITNNKKISLRLIELFKYIKLENLTTTNIKYKNKKVNLSLIDQDKNKLLNFLTIYNNTIIIKK